MFSSACFLAIAFGQPVVGQVAEDDPVRDASVHIGPVGLNPGVTVRDVGVDNNVFNEINNPKRDFTFTIEPTLTILMRTRRGLLTADGRLDLVYFNTYDTERSINGFSHARYEYAFNRFKPFASLSALDTRERPGYEIDARARRFENTFQIGLDAKVASKSTLQIGVRRQTVAYAGEAIFLGRRLEDVLNRTLGAADVNWRQQLTVLTTVVVNASSERERFTFSPARNSNSLRFRGGLELGRFALIRGNAFVGYRRLKPVEGSALPEFSGITADVNVAYTAPTQTRLSLGIARDIQYSFEITNPYYVQTGWTAGLTQRVIGRWEVRVTGGQDRLAYRTSQLTVGARVDRVDRVGGGVGYALGDDTSVGFVVESIKRNSDEPGRQYQSVRSFGSVNYAF